MTWRADLRELSDNDLLARLRTLPRASAGYAAICEILVERYAHLVQACVRPYRHSPEPVEDLMQVGYVGLLKAISNFDPAAGDSLSAYAAPCISGEVKRYFRDKRWQVRVRRPIQELLLEMRAMTSELAQQLGRPPGDGGLAAALKVTEDDIREARQASLAFTASSLDAPLTDREDAALLADVAAREGRVFRRQGQLALPRRHDVRRLGEPGPRRLGEDHPPRPRRGDQLRRHRRRLRRGRV